VAIVLVLAGSWFGYQQLSGKGCKGQIKLTVAAATEIAPAVEQAAQQWTADGANVNGTCVAVNVSGVNPATMAAAVAREHKVSLTGLGPAPASVSVPDVWLPDSSTWLLRLKSEATGFVPTDARRSRRARSWWPCPRRSPRRRSAGQTRRSAGKTCSTR
jgi:Ca-activated chloride channel homolog